MYQCQVEGFEARDVHRFLLRITQRVGDSPRRITIETESMAQQRVRSVAKHLLECATEMREISESTI